MARDEADREDLLAEAIALAERAELRLLESAEPVVVGFRRDGAFSCYFGPDPVYQFNGRGELRRGYLAGELLKAQDGSLVALRRVRTANAVELRSRPLTPPQQAELLAEMHARLERLQAMLEQGQYELVGQVPPEGQVVARCTAWLASRPKPPRIARAPHAGAT